MQIQWQAGLWTNPSVPKAEAEIIISADWAPIRTFEPIIKNSPEAIYGNVLPELRNADLRITNLECPLIKTGKPVWKSGSVLLGHPDSLPGLTSVPFEIATLANNHMFDYGIDGFKETLSHLKAHSIRTVGAGLTASAASSPLQIDLKGCRLAIVNLSEGEDLTAAQNGPGVFGWEIETTARQIQKLRATVDFILVIGHCGLEYIPFPPPYVVKAFKHLAEAGADLIVGHHPHVPQGIQIHQGVPICYSQGNFVFYQETDLLYRKTGYLVKAGIARNSLAYLRIIPYRIGAQGLSLLNPNESSDFFKTLKQISDPLQTADGTADAWHGFLKYYHLKGFRSEVRSILDRFATEPQKAAAMFRNRVTTMQHREHWIDFLTRMMDDSIDKAPDWAYDLAQLWFTQKV